MKITKVEIVKLENSKRLRATCFIVLDYTIVIDNVKLFENYNGEFFVEFPRSHSSEEKNYQDITIIKPQFRDSLVGTVLKEYKKKLKEEDDGKTNNIGQDIKGGQSDSGRGKDNSRRQVKSCKAESWKKGAFQKIQRGTKRIDT